MISLTKEKIKKISDKLEEPLKECLESFYDKNIEEYESIELLTGMLHQINQIYKITAYMLLDSAVDKKIVKKMLHKIITENLLNDFT